MKQKKKKKKETETDSGIEMALTNHLPGVPEVFLACGGNFRCWPKANMHIFGRRLKPQRLDRNRKPR